MEEEDLNKALESLKLSQSRVEKTRFGESYIVDKSTGSRYILPTKRADGTLRKEIKIRPGYIPPEERQVYIPVHRRVDYQSDGKSALESRESDSNLADDSKKSLKTSKPPNVVSKPVSSELKNNNKLKNKQDSNRTKPNLNNIKSNKLNNESKLFDSDAKIGNNSPTTTSPKEDVSLDHNQNENEVSTVYDEKKLKTSINNTLRKIKEVKLLQEKFKKGLELDPNQQKKINRLPELEQKLNELRMLDRWDLK